MAFPKDQMAVSLEGKVAIISGASGGIGKAIAIALAEKGVKVGLGARRQKELEEVVQIIKKNGGQAIAIPTGVTVRQQVKNLAAETVKAFGPIDILVNNAGIWHLTLMESLKEDLWEKMIDTNCKGTLNSIGAVLEGMVERKSGHIVNISSCAGNMHFLIQPGLNVYGATKYFMEGLSASMRQELDWYGIRVTVVQPGLTDTPGVRVTKAPEGNSPFAVSFKLLTPEDVAGAVIYAVSQPSYVAINEVLIQEVKGRL